jgi:long-subunit acyl-CoA synthetase (AMP-forming)
VNLTGDYIWSTERRVTESRDGSADGWFATGDIGESLMQKVI